MNTMQLRCFLTAARCLSFTESAAELFISQPALSHNISSLEHEWGVELFIRDKKHKNTRLTPAGEVMYAGLSRLQDQFECLLQNARNIQEGKTGTLRIGLISSDRIDEHILRILEKFQEKYPDVELTLKRGIHSELDQWLYNHTVDIAFVLKIDFVNKPWLVLHKLYSIESVLILTAKHPLAKKKNLSLIDFQNETFVSLSAKESWAVNALLKQECEKAGFIPNVLEAPDINAQVLFLESGKGVAVGSINNIAALNNHMTMLRLRDLKPLELVIAFNRANDNACIPLFCSGYEPIE